MYCSQKCADWGLSTVYLKRNYNITLDDYHILYEDQKGLCAICGLKGWKMADYHKLELVVDHCHTTGKVRGLLCHNCNRGIGLLKELSKNFYSAIQYLESAETILDRSTSETVADGSA